MRLTAVDLDGEWNNVRSPSHGEDTAALDFRGFCLGDGDVCVDRESAGSGRGGLDVGASVGNIGRYGQGGCDKVGREAPICVVEEEEERR